MGGYVANANGSAEPLSPDLADVLGYVDLEKIGIVEVGARAGLRFGVNRA